MAGLPNAKVVSNLINDDFAANGISCILDALPSDEHNKISKSNTNLENFCKYLNRNELLSVAQEGKPLEIDSVVPFFALNKSYYKNENLFRFYSSLEGENAAEQYPTLFSYASECAEIFFRKKYLRKDMRIEFISEFCHGRECDSKLTRFHVDRFIPAIKLLYSPMEIGIVQSPFEYVKGSHIIETDSYYQSIKLYDSRVRVEKDAQDLWSSLPMFDGLLPTKMIMEANSLYLVATNGLHRRSGFTASPENRSFRHMVFIDFYSFFKKTDLMAFI